MRAALGLAGRGLGRVWPNPAVGCILVRDGRVVGRGATGPGGRPHAETVALAQAGAAAAGATAYVSLEPCAHHGQTPPCAEALIAAGVARVVYAAADPDPRVDGRGEALLRAAGIAVTAGVCRAEAEALNAGFISRVRRNRPLVTLKLATTLDGFIATSGGESKWITGAAARRRAHLLRAQNDAILVGSGTVLADDPELTCRLPGMAARSPVRVVLDRRLRTPPESRLMQTARSTPVWLFSAVDRPSGAFTAAGVELCALSATADGAAAMTEVMTILAGRGITRLLVEGGATVAASLLAAQLVDRIAWFRAPAVMGAGRPVVDGFAAGKIADLRRFRRIDCEPLGDDLLESYAVHA